MLCLVAKAENCTKHAIHDVLQPMASDPNYAQCQSDSSYSLLSLETPSLSQTRGFCASPSCQALLSAMRASSLLPDCEVAIGAQSLSFPHAASMVLSKCSSAPPLSLDERVVDKDDARSKAQRVSGHVASVLGHSAPMDEVGEVAGALLGLLRG
ncbi:hypothetical protein PHYPSEUDO_012971 [Phytophthora pseudosyringae]|uniref:Elicitin n=1 Tax=Phytophthora pseudosyringae TaxID=221518 RepID=A0A8T1W8Z8_9STRA|nr:hypothetical protein PHYPSEUDO_012971 [Phytophthora pseudosyringae]